MWGGVDDIAELSRDSDPLAVDVNRTVLLLVTVSSNKEEWIMVRSQAYEINFNVLKFMQHEVVELFC